MILPGFKFERDANEQRIVITLSSRATVDVWWAAVSTLVAENVWRTPVIYDMSAVDSAPLLLNLPNLVRLVADLNKQHGSRGPVAVVVRDVELWSGRLSGLFRHHLTVEAFGDVASAADWLDKQAKAGTPCGA
jgi:hypothetical protein